MTTDERVELARQLAEAMKKEWERGVQEAKRGRPPKPKELEFSRNEWEKWAQYARRNGLTKALQFVEGMAVSSSLREDPKRAAQCISRVMKAHQVTLNKLSAEELNEVLGYVGRWIIWLNFTGGMDNEESAHGHAGRKPGRRH